MRLIDADKINFFDCLAKTGNSVCCHAKGIVSKDGIDVQPTVEAIPIEWIKEYVDFGVSDELAQRYRRFVLNMIKDWEKENDR